MAQAKTKKPRGPSLGVNFEHGQDGAVVAYTGTEEVVLALLPPDTPVTVTEANALAIAYRRIGQVLNASQSLRVVKEIKLKPKIG
jgi:hypothetical protein